MVAPISLATPVTGGTVTTVDALVPARDRCLPVDEVLASMLPDAGLQRGRVVGCRGPAAWSLALALISRAAGTGSWVAFVGAPMVGLEAAAEFGVPLGRVVLVAVDEHLVGQAVGVGAGGAAGDELAALGPYK